MKKINVLLYLLTFLGFAVVSCDIVEEPVIPTDGIQYQEDEYGPAPEFNNSTSEQQIKRVLLEDFTGQQCGYCPEAAVLATDIDNDNPGLINVIAIHSGSLAASDGDHYTNEFDTEEGDIYFAQLSFQTNPIGRVNRAPGPEMPLAVGQWIEKVDDQLALDPELVIQVETEFHADNQHLNVHIFSELLVDYPEKIRMVALITEGHIIGPQLDYSIVDDPETAENEQIIDEYEFEHVLRGSVNGAAGVTVADNDVAGFTSLKSYTYSWNNSWNIDNSHLVVFAYDNATGQVLNTIQIDLGE